MEQLFLKLFGTKKNYVISLLLLLFATGVYGQSQKTNFNLKFKITGISDYVGVFGLAFDGNNTLYSDSLKNGVCQLTGFVNEPTVFRVGFSRGIQFVKGDGGSYLPYKCSSFWVIVSPNDQFTIEGDLTGKDFVDLYCRSNKENQIFAEFLSAYFPPMNLHGRNAVCLMKNKDLSEEAKKRIYEEQAKYDKEQAEIRLNFLKKNANSVGALWLMEDMLIRSQIGMADLKPIFAKVDVEKYGKLSYFQSVKRRIDATELSVIGKVCPNVVTNESYDGKPFDLKQLRGKYVILDFWGTWCGACIKGMPDMKTLRDKYSDRLEIVGIAKESGKNVDPWKQMIEAKGMNWPNILVGKGDKDFVSMFNVQGFPTKILIDPKGVIIYRLTGESKEFYNEVGRFIQ